MPCSSMRHPALQVSIKSCPNLVAYWSLPSHPWPGRRHKPACISPNRALIILESLPFFLLGKACTTTRPTLGPRERVFQGRIERALRHVGLGKLQISSSTEEETMDRTREHAIEKERHRQGGVEKFVGRQGTRVLSPHFVAILKGSFQHWASGSHQDFFTS